MPRRVRVAILDDHQSIVDGYLYRLSALPQIEVVGTARYGEELEPMLARHPHTDVLILDMSVPTAPHNANPYSMLHEIPNLLQKFPHLNILVITMFAEPALICAATDAGASGYILKDDQAMIQDLGNVVMSVADDGICFSQRAHQILLARHTVPTNRLLSARQLEAISVCAAYPDQTTAELAKKLTVSNSTVRNLLSGAYMRLGVRTRAAAIEKARDLGLISPRIPRYSK